MGDTHVVRCKTSVIVPATWRRDRRRCRSSGSLGNHITHNNLILTLDLVVEVGAVRVQLQKSRFFFNVKKKNIFFLDHVFSRA